MSMSASDLEFNFIIVPFSGYSKRRGGWLEDEKYKLWCDDEL